MAATKSRSKTAAKKTKAAARTVKAAPSKAKKGAASASKKAGAVKRKPSGSSKAKAAKASKAKAAAAAKPKAAAKTQATKTAKSAATKTKKDVLDFGEFPAGSFTRHEVTLCLSCIFKLFTQQLGLAPRTAYNEIRRYAPTVGELTAREPQRPFFKPTAEKNPRCPYCDAAKRWHAQLRVHRVEVHEEKRTARQVFFEWLERLGQALDFESDAAWMPAAAREYLQRREPKTDWAEVFSGVRQVRRSQRLEAGWERDGARLFLAPALYNDVLLVQYLVSRSHRHGGRTFEGRLTLPDLVGRMRRGGHLEAQGITDHDRFDVLEQLVEHLTGGDEPARLHFILDRRDLLDKVKDVYARHAT
jgi:hypothetical protein